MDYLATGVDTGIRATRAMHADGTVRDFGQRTLKLRLNGRNIGVGLNLPAAIGATIVLNRANNSTARRVRGSRKWIGVGVLNS